MLSLNALATAGPQMYLPEAGFGVSRPQLVTPISINGNVLHSPAPLVTHLSHSPSPDPSSLVFEYCPIEGDGFHLTPLAHCSIDTSRNTMKNHRRRGEEVCKSQIEYHLPNNPPQLLALPTNSAPISPLVPCTLYPIQSNTTDIVRSRFVPQPAFLVIGRGVYHRVVAMLTPRPSTIVESIGDIALVQRSLKAP
ncbi:hypothetical protein FA13DRAFT_1718151 [Coprinellus micaceus]|uniref:Uncharacterized protein n=1 Tax=Coprinellus micaceus TaxID=71717 RepID=A0A4Y7SE30_COPMI|nr:hypothetical protein FA13DRAFT_1718151 [Coprinellus micaceus]